MVGNMHTHEMKTDTVDPFDSGLLTILRARAGEKVALMYEGRQIAIAKYDGGSIQIVQATIGPGQVGVRF